MCLRSVIVDLGEAQDARVGFCCLFRLNTRRGNFSPLCVCVSIPKYSYKAVVLDRASGPSWLTWQRLRVRVMFCSLSRLDTCRGHFSPVCVCVAIPKHSRKVVVFERASGPSWLAWAGLRARGRAVSLVWKCNTNHDYPVLVFCIESQISS